MAGPNTWNELIVQLNAILDNFGLTVGEDVVSSNVVDVTDFSKATGAYANSPNVPWEAPVIPLNLVGAVKGGITSIWYKGAELTKDSFTGGTVTMFSGTNIVNELCRVFIDYDLASGAFSVNILTGFTGDIPGGVNDIVPPAKMLISSIINTPSSDIVPPAKMNLTTIEFSDESGPSVMIITDII